MPRGTHRLLHKGQDPYHRREVARRPSRLHRRHCEGLGAVVFAVGGTEDHVHIVANLPAKRAPADVIRELKKASSTWASARCPGFAWQTGYGAFGFSARERTSRVAYVNGQVEHHKTVSSADELRALLAENGIEWDERYFD